MTVEPARTGRVGFIGIGRMGAAMFDCVLAAGFAGAVHDVRAEATDSYRAGPHDVIVASTPRELAARCGVIDVVVNSDQDVLDCCLGEDGVVAGSRPGTVVLLHSTIAHATLRKVAGEGDLAGVHVLDAPVSGRWGHQSVGDLAVMVGGDEKAFAVAEPVLVTFGGLVVHLGRLGAGLDTKLALNLLRYQTMLATKEAGMLLAAAEVEVAFDQLVEHTGAMGLMSGPPPNPDVIQREMRTPERLLNNAATARKDLRAAVARGAELGVELLGSAKAIEAVHSFWDVEAPEDFSRD